MNPATTEPFTTFEMLVANERTRLIGLCRHFTGDSQAAEDLAQETLLIAWRQRHKITDPDGLSHWLTAIARNVCRHHLRAQKRGQMNRPHANQATLPEPVADFDLEVELERSELIGLLDKALGLLPAETRGLLIQHYIEGLPQAELGAQFGLTKGTVAVRLHRGKLALRQALVNDFRDDAVAYGLVTPEHASWQETRIWCVVCGQHRLLGQFDHANDELQLRCPSCNQLHDEQDRIHYSHSSFLRGVKAYKPAVSRILHWTYDYYLKNSQDGIVPCLECGRLQPLRVGTPPGAIDCPPEIYAWCEECGYCSGSSAWNGLALSTPQVLHFWRDHPRMRAIPPRELEIAGSPAVLVGFESVTDDAKIEVAFAQNTFAVIELD